MVTPDRAYCSLCMRSRESPSVQNCILVGAPVDSGQKTAGCLMGPTAYRVAGLGSTLIELGHRVSDWGDIATPPGAEATADGRVHAEATTVAWTRTLADAAGMAMAEGFPIFLGGDHAMSLGTVSGVASHAKAAGRPLFVLWLDAHSDFHTPVTTQSGNIHGMPVAYLAGREGFDAFPPFPHPVPAENICLFGIRSVDAAERAALKGR